MIYIKLDNDMDLTITVNEPIYRGDNLARKITYLIPQTVGEIDMLVANVYLCYIRADGTPDVVVLDRLEEKYNDTYLQYRFPVGAKLTKYAGEICTWIQIFSGDPCSPTTAKSGECVLRVSDAKDLDDYIADSTLTAIYQLHTKMEEGLDSVSGQGAVYVPHIDERKILSFTVEDEPTEVPDPVDLNPFDEWNNIDESEVDSDYIWEPM